MRNIWIICAIVGLAILVVSAAVFLISPPAPPFAGPSVSSVYPNSGFAGQALNVSIAGTNFSDVLSLTFGEGITVNDFYVDSATQIIATIAIEPSAPLGLKDVSVTTSVSSGIGIGLFTVHDFVPDVRHSGDLVIDGSTTMTIENSNYFQEGNVYINDEAKLVIRNSRFMLGRGDVPTIHMYIFVSRGASLEIEDSTVLQNVFTEAIGHPVHIVIRTDGRVSITNSYAAIHLVEVYEGARVEIVNSTLVNVNPPGGLVQVSGGRTEVIGSTIGAIGLSVPAGAHLTASGLRSGVRLASWDVHVIIPDANYDVVFENSYILKDELKEELKHGPYERGWLFFPDPDAYVKISDSELRKVFIDLQNENVKFENLRMDTPSSLRYRETELNNTIVKGQWPFTINDSEVTITNSEYLFLQPSGHSYLHLVNSHMVEFIPRDFFGTIVFENFVWTTAGEIMGGLPFHSTANDFVIKGSLRISQELRHNLQWKQARVTREYEILVIDKNNGPVKGAVIKIGGETFTVDNAGAAKFNLVFDENNYDEPQVLKAFDEEITYLIAQADIDFFTETPVVLSR